MNSIFRMDGPFYRFGNALYYLIISNILWVIFSLPLFTIGASTTALFYVMGKVVRDEDPSVIKEFWKSFKMNFKQSTIVWFIMIIAYAIVITNLRNINLMGGMSKYILPFQIAVLIEFIIVTIYIFPLLSRYHMTIKNLFKTSFLIGNRHLLTTLLCMASLGVIVVLFYKLTGLFILISISLYALCSSFIISNVLKKYMPDEKQVDDSQSENTLSL